MDDRKSVSNNSRLSPVHKYDTVRGCLSIIQDSRRIPDEELSLTPEDIRRIFAAAALRDSLNDVSYCKLIER